MIVSTSLPHSALRPRLRCRNMLWSAGRQHNTSLRHHAQRATSRMLTNDTTSRTRRTCRRQSRTRELDLYAMANLQPKTTGLPMTVYISNRTAGHEPRVVISQQHGDQLISSDLSFMTIKDNPRIIGKLAGIRNLMKVHQLLMANQGLLLHYWYQ